MSAEAKARNEMYMCDACVWSLSRYGSATIVYLAPVTVDARCVLVLVGGKSPRGGKEVRRQNHVDKRAYRA